MSEKMTHFCTFVRRQDYVRAAYWLGRVESELSDSQRAVMNQELLGATYRKPNHTLLLATLDVTK